tara:strand:- start:446 stop:901 length:456 start_codon:yes stop_codon:yes gene_type:complete
MVSNTESIDIIRIPSNKIIDVFPLVKKEINLSLKKQDNGYDVDNILQELQEDLLTMWIAWDIKNNKHIGIVIGQIYKRPKFKVFSIFMVLGKDREKWQHLAQKKTEDFALENDCHKCVHPARKGWSKIFKKHDYKETHVVLEKTLIKKERT